jgi:hypothetical protein
MLLLLMVHCGAASQKDWPLWLFNYISARLNVKLRSSLLRAAAAAADKALKQIDAKTIKRLVRD